jgi:hypothetical protein
LTSHWLNIHDSTPSSVQLSFACFSLAELLCSNLIADQYPSVDFSLAVNPDHHRHLSSSLFSDFLFGFQLNQLISNCLLTTHWLKIYDGTVHLTNCLLPISHWLKSFASNSSTDTAGHNLLTSHWLKSFAFQNPACSLPIEYKMESSPILTDRL